MIFILEGIFKGLLQWVYSLLLELAAYIAGGLLDVFGMDLAYFRTAIPVTDEITAVMTAAGWALLLGNLVFQSAKSMMSGMGFEADDPRELFARTFVFSFLLLASGQICEIGLGISRVLIDMLGIPEGTSSVFSSFPEEDAFSIGASWLLVIIVGLVLMWQIVKLFFEIGERYFLVGFLTITAPLAFATGGSGSTADIFKGWARMYASMCLMMVMNVVFLKILLSAMSVMPTGAAVFPWLILVVAIARVARKIDGLIARIGLNPAITGDGLGRGLPGMLSYTVIRSAMSNISRFAKTGHGKASPGGSSASGSSPRGPSRGGPSPAAPSPGGNSPGFGGNGSRGGAGQKPPAGPGGAASYAHDTENAHIHEASSDGAAREQSTSRDAAFARQSEHTAREMRPGSERSGSNAAYPGGAGNGERNAYPHSGPNAKEGGPPGGGAAGIRSTENGAFFEGQSGVPISRGSVSEKKTRSEGERAPRAQSRMTSAPPGSRGMQSILKGSERPTLRMSRDVKHAPGNINAGRGRDSAGAGNAGPGGAGNAGPGGAKANQTAFRKSASAGDRPSAAKGAGGDFAKGAVPEPSERGRTKNRPGGVFESARGISARKSPSEVSGPGSAGMKARTRAPVSALPPKPPQSQTAGIDPRASAPASRSADAGEKGAASRNERASAPPQNARVRSEKPESHTPAAGSRAKPAGSAETRPGNTNAKPAFENAKRPAATRDKARIDRDPRQGAPQNRREPNPARTSGLADIRGKPSGIRAARKTPGEKGEEKE